jgi:nucleoid DNA-binding protein
MSFWIWTIPNSGELLGAGFRVLLSRMKREELARKLARQSRVSGAQARDQIDEMVRKILKALREGKPVKLPGVGRLISIPAERKGGKSNAASSRRARPQ